MSKPWTIAEWKRAHVEGVEVELPSGMVVRVRPVNVSTFLKAGRIPDEMTPTVARLIGDGQKEQPEPSMEDMLTQMRLLDAFALTCIMSPVIVEGPDCGEDELTVDMLADSDKVFLFAFLGRPATELARFSPRPPHAVDDLGDQPGDAPVT